nr:hypothetical protein [Tanacetum cinerariifolium]
MLGNTLEYLRNDVCSESNEESDDEETREEESFDPIPRTPEDSEDDGNGKEDQGLRINSHVTLTLVHPDGQQESSSVSSQFVTSMLNPTSDAGMESIFATASSLVAPLQTSSLIMTPSTIATITTISHAPISPTPIPNKQTHLLKPSLTFWVKGQVKKHVSKILPRIKQSVNAQLEAKVLTRSSHSSRTSYGVEADLSKMELKKILIEKIEGNKSIQRFDEQRNLYNALVEAYEADKIILDTYGERVILKRRRNDDDDDQGEGHPAGSDRGSKRQREGKEPESASAPLEPATRSTGRSTKGSKSRQASASESAFIAEPVQTIYQIEEPSHPVFKTGAEDQSIIQTSQYPEWFFQPKKPPTPDRDWNKTLPDTPLDFSNFIMNRLRVDTLTPELLAGPTYELMKRSCKSLTELEYHFEEVYKAMMDQLDWVNHEGQQYPHNLLQHLPLIPDNRGHHVIPFAHFVNNDLEYLRGGASRRKYTTSVTKTKATDYGHIKWIEDLVPHWISVRRDDDKIYKFKEDDFKRLSLQDIEDMLLLLVHGKLSNLTVEERFAFNVSLRMFKRSIVIQRRVEDLQLGVESYQKRLNLTKPDMYRSDLKHQEAYTAYSNPRGFIYENKDKKNRLMRIDELYKFRDGTLIDVHNALDDHLKGIRMQYLPQTI